MIVARAKTSDFQLDRWIHSDWEQLRKRGVTVSSLARLIAVPRTTLRDALKKTERERERQPERRGRPRALTCQQALRAGRRGSWWMHAQLFFFWKTLLIQFFRLHAKGNRFIFGFELLSKKCMCCSICQSISRASLAK